MLIGVTVICCSLLYSILVSTVYFSKRKLKNAENRFYGFLLKINIVGLLLELSCSFFLYNQGISPMFEFVNVVVNRLFLIYLLTWECVFTIYMILISFSSIDKVTKEINSYHKKLFTYFGIFYLLSLVLVTVLPLYYYNDGTYLYSYGPATNLLFLIGGIFIMIDFYCLFKNIKTINKKKYYPLFVLVLLMVFVFVLRSINPGLIIINSVFAFVTVLMYFTIENPDVQMLGEIYKAKEYAETSNNQKSIFLFNITQQIREPLREINRFSKEALMNNNMELVKENLRKIKYASNNGLALVNDVLDISELENRKIPIESHKYQPANLFKSLSSVVKLQLKGKPIELRLNYDDSIPESLDGDSLRLKQILSTLLDNAVDYTENGFIEFSMNSVIKYNVCRLIITVEDSGKGIPADQLIRLFDKGKEMIENNQEIDDSQKNLALAKTLVDLIGGTITVSSEVGKGSKFTVVIDQQIYERNHSESDIAVEQYKKMYVEKSRILIVTSDDKLMAKMTKLLEKLHISYDLTSTGQECLEKIRNHETYQMIIMDEELPKLSSVHTFEKLKSIDGFHLPVILMTEHKDIETKDAYINMGFQETISIPFNKEEIKQLLDKYLKK